MSYTVIVCDLFHCTEPDHEMEIPGFLTKETAIEYARRRLRRSLEEVRKPGQFPEELRRLWRTFGEDCYVVGLEGIVYRASSELDDFLHNPATPQECDYNGLYESLLPKDFALRWEWSAGTMPPPYHYEYSLVLKGYEASQKACPPRMQGEITFWPDYPGSSVPAWRETFFVWTPECLRVYALLHDGDLLKGKTAPREESPLGGETVILEVTAKRKTVRIASFELSKTQRLFLLEKVAPAVKAMVPDHLWQRLQARQKAYHEKKGE